MTSSSKTEDLDCLTCGVCCVCPYEDRYFIDMTLREARELDRSQLKYLFPLNQTPGGGEVYRYLRTKTFQHEGITFCVCAALQGVPTQKVSCSIYKNRPRICRIFEKGSVECQEVRNQFRREFIDF